ncbi:MAG TPA: type II secretion system protein GspN, partial [Polyangiaceae bacterium]
MTPRLKRALVIVGYVAFYAFALVVFFYWTFPYDRLKERIVRDFNARQTGPDAMRLELDALSSYWLSGIEADGLRLVSPPEGTGKSKKPNVTSIEHAHARISLLSLLVGRRAISFGADAFGGSVDGSVSDSDAERVVEIDIDALDLGQTPMLAGLIGLPVSGALSGTVELTTPEAQLGKAEGKISLKMTGLSVGDGKAKIRDIIALPKLDAGTLTLEAEVKSGTVKVTQLSGSGPDLEVAAEGTIRLRNQPGQSTLALTSEFKFTDRYTNKDDMTRALFGPSGAFDLDRKNRAAKRADGFYSWRITGTLDKPHFLPAAG